MDILTVAAAAAAGAAAGAVGTAVGYARSRFADVAAETSAEVRILAVMGSEPDVGAAVCQAGLVTADHFSLPEHRQWYETLASSDGRANFEQAPEGVNVACDADTFEADVEAFCRAVRSDSMGEALNAVDVFAALDAAHIERDVYLGSAGRHWKVNPSRNPQRQFDRPLVRLPLRPSAKSLTGGALLGAAAGVAAVISLGMSGHPTYEQVVLFAAVALPFIVGASTLSSVDRLTLYLDERAAALWVGTLMAGLFVTYAAGVRVHTLFAVLTAIVVVSAFELSAALFRRLSARPSHGLGDAAVMPVGVTIPLVLAFTPGQYVLTATTVVSAAFIMAVAHALLSAAMYVMFDWSRAAANPSHVAGLPGWLFGPLFAAPVVAALN